MISRRAILGAALSTALAGTALAAPRGRYLIPARAFETVDEGDYTSPDHRYRLGITIEYIQLKIDFGKYPVFKIYPTAGGREPAPVCRIGWDDESSFLWHPLRPHTLVYSMEGELCAWDGERPREFRRLVRRRRDHKLIFRGLSRDGRTAYYTHLPDMVSVDDAHPEGPGVVKERERLLQVRLP